MDGCRVSTKNAELVHSFSFVTLNDEDLFISLPFNDRTLEFRVSFIDDFTPGKKSGVMTFPEPSENGTERGAIIFQNMLNAGEITPLNAFILYEDDHTRDLLLMVCELKDPHKGSSTSPHNVHRTIVMSFWKKSLLGGQ